jgi:phage terminase large subunit
VANAFIHPDNFNEVYLPYLKNLKRYNIFYGGAGSGKSVFVVQREVIHNINLGTNLLVVRKVGKTNRDSTFALFKSIISAWNLGAYFKINQTDMRITNKLNGAQIVFAGLDDVEKLKSITFENGVLHRVWIEEASEIAKKDFIQLNLRLRGKLPKGKFYQITVSFNPIEVTHWLKDYFFDNNSKSEKTSILHTNYKDNRFLDDEYIETLESFEDEDKYYYNVYTLGEWGVLGNVIYNKYKVWDFLHQSKLDFDNIDKFIGLDFGYNHPAVAALMSYYDDEIYIHDEIYMKKQTNDVMIEEVTDRWGKDYSIIADSASPDKIEEFAKEGFDIKGAKKNKESVKHGIDWIKRRLVHIMPHCQNHINEFQSYKWKEDKNGDIIDEPVKYHDDCMDADRYALDDHRLEIAEEGMFEGGGERVFAGGKRRY